MKSQEIQFAFKTLKLETLQDLVPSSIVPFMFFLNLADSNFSPRSIQLLN